MPLFGPAGDSDSFAATKKSKLFVPEWLAERGLTAYEYQCGRGVRVNPKTAVAFKQQADAFGIAVSLHAPYYISLASADLTKRENSIGYILQSARAVTNLGGTRIVVHPGGLSGFSREEATAIAAETLQKAQAVLDEEGLSQVRICPETMGKMGQLGDLEEVLTLCQVDERFIPCIDFGHLNSRMQGAVNSKDAFARVLEAVHNRLGQERARQIHMHFSKIEYTTGGEKQHLTFADTLFGPEPEPLMELIYERNLAPTIICESRGTQAEDAAAMMAMYHQLTVARD